MSMLYAAAATAKSGAAKPGVSFVGILGSVTILAVSTMWV